MSSSNSTCSLLSQSLRRCKMLNRFCDESLQKTIMKEACRAWVSTRHSTCSIRKASSYWCLSIRSACNGATKAGCAMKKTLRCSLPSFSVVARILDSVPLAWNRAQPTCKTYQQVLNHAFQRLWFYGLQRSAGIPHSFRHDQRKPWCNIVDKDGRSLRLLRLDFQARDKERCIPCDTRRRDRGAPARAPGVFAWDPKTRPVNCRCTSWRGGVVWGWRRVLLKCSFFNCRISDHSAQVQRWELRTT